MRRTPEQAAQTRQAVLDAALDVFSAKGYAGARLSDVAAAAGVTRGAIYWHFRDKADLYQQLLGDKLARAHETAARARAAPSSSPLAVLETTMIAFVEALEDEDYRRTLQLVWFKFEATGDLADGFDQKVRGIIARIAGMQSLIEAAIACEEIPPQDSELAARAAYALMGGLMMLNLFDERLLHPSAHARPAIQIFLAGLRSPSSLPPPKGS